MKKLISATLAATLALSLAACGSSASTSEATPAESTASSAAESAAEHDAVRHRSGVRTGRFSQGLHLQPPSLRCAELLCRLHGRAPLWAGHRRFQL